MKKVIAIVAITQILLCQGLGFAQNWLPVGPGIGCNPSEYVWDLAQTSNGDSLIIAGVIATDGNCDSARAILTWNGYTFNAPGGYVVNTQSGLVLEFQNRLYSSGHFNVTNNNFNVLFDGNWQSVPGGFDGGANDFLIKDNLLYLAGAFSGTANGLVCTFDGTQQQDYYTGPPNSEIAMSLEFYEDTLFVSGGYISSVESEAYDGFSKCCKIVNGQLEKVAQGFSLQGFSWSVKEFQNKLYIGGYLKTLGGDAYHTMFYYENGTLHTLPEEPDDLVTGFVVHDDGLYVCGDFHSIGSMPCEHVGRWDGQSWTCLCNDVFYDSYDNLCDAQCIKDIEVWKDTLYIGGYFNKIGDVEMKRIAKLDMNLSDAFPVSVSESSRDQMKIFPNPAENILTIHGTFDSDLKSSTVSIHDQYGKKIMATSSQTKNEIQVDISSLATGNYFIKVVAGSSVFVQRFVKE